MRTAVLTVLALAGCQAERPPERPPAPSSASVSEQIVTMFEKTCGISNPSAESIDAAIRAQGVNASREGAGMAFYSMREVRNGVFTNARLEENEGVLRCTVGSSDSDEPAKVVEHLATTIQENGGTATEPLDAGLGYGDCRTYRIGATLQSACTYDFSPHGMSADLILTVSTDNAAAS
jgi:hypothetical protein